MSASFDGMEIAGGKEGDLGGAIFTLSDGAGITEEFDAPDGSQVAVAAHSRGLVVRKVQAASYEEAWRTSLVAAQQALDVFSARGLADLRISEPQYDHIAIYGEDGGQVLRIAGVATINVQAGPVRVVVRDASGREIPQPPPVTDWHPSMRYYRQSQLADDVFASLWSLWLAFENLLDDFEPIQKGEREKSWLKRAFERVDNEIGLARFLPRERQSQVPKDAAYKFFYDDARTHLFHAKASRQPLLPHEAAGTTRLITRHGHLTSLYLELLQHVTGVRRSRNALMSGGFKMMTEGLDRDPLTVATDDEAPFDPDAETVYPESGAFVELPTRHESALDRPFLRVYVGAVRGDDAKHLDVIRKTGFQSEGYPITAHVVEGELQVADLQGLEVQTGVAARNVGLPKTFAEM